jgi:drug/metabolite transporter (DMT)-like permease
LTTTTPAKQRRSIVLVIIFTVLSATAQVLMKTGANNLKVNPSIASLLTNLPLFAGLALYGLGAALMILALRHGELSLLYPMISLSYVWVALLSVLIFHETMNPLKIAGICVIMLGVGILGRGSRA